MNNLKKLKKKNILLWITIILLTISITGFSILAYFIYNAFNITDDKFRLGPSLSAKSDSKILRVKNIEEKKEPFIVEYPIKSTNNKNVTYFLNQKELNDFQVFLFQNLWYGPEIFELKHIIINDWRFFEQNNHGEYLSDGFYVSDTNEIYINVESEGIRDIVFNNYDENSEEYKISKRYKFDFLLTIIGHEYGHHFTHTYFQSVRYDEGTKNTYSEGGKSFPWNKEYYRKFLELNNFKNTEKIRPNKDSRDSSPPISSILSLSDIYTWASETKHSSSTIFANNVESPNKLYLFWNYENKTLPIAGHTLAYSYKNSTTNSFDSLRYVYSISEQSTRQIEQLMLHMDWSLYGISNLTDIPRDLTYYQRTKTLHTFWVDLLRVYGIDIYKIGTKESILSTNLNFPNALYGGVYNNKIINDISRDYYKFLLSGIGFNKEISKIWTKNNAHMKNNNTGIDGGINNKLIRFAGYIPNDYKSIIIDKNANNELLIKKSMPLNNSNLGNGIFNFNLKTSLLADRNDKSTYIHPWDMIGFETSLNKSSYVLDDFIEGQKLINHKLYFWKGDLNSNNIVDDDEVKLVNDINIFGKEDQSISSYPHGLALQDSAYDDGKFSMKFYSAKLIPDGNLIWEFK